MTHTASGFDLGERLQATLGSGYQVQGELGGGGMSRVFAVRDIALQRDIVVKMLPPEMAGELSTERFKQEIQFAASLQHPHIVPVHAAGDADGLPYYTMPKVEGESLRDHLLRRQRLAVSEALTILRDVARALAYAHHRGIVHRDIKPDNVLIAHGVAQVTDFGIAKAIAAARADERADQVVPQPTRPGLTMTGTSLGTPEYMAPEQVAGDPRMDHRVDLYALGVVGYELLAGRAPFHGRTPREQLTAQMSERPRELAELRLDLPPAVAQLIMRALEKDPSARPASADDMVRELEAAIVGTPVSVSADGPEVIRRAFGWYVVSFAAAAGIAWTAMQAMGLPDWVFPGAIALMALGLPIVAFTALARYAAFQAASGAPARRSGSHGWLGTRSLWAAQYLSWRRVTVGGATSLGGFGILVAGVMVTRSMGIGPAATLFSQGALREREALVVTDFQSSGVDSGLVSAVSAAARAGLMQSSVISFLWGDPLDAALARMRRPAGSAVDLRLGRELATREGLRGVVAGHVIRAGAGFDVGIRLVSADSGTELASFHRVARSEEDILAVVDALTRDLRGKIGESLRQVRASPPLPQVTSPSLAALRLYGEALRSDKLKALELLREAVAIDTEFAMAYRKMWTLGAFTPEGDSAHKKAVRYQSRLSERERLAIDGSRLTALYLFPDANRPKAVAAYEKLASMGDPLGMNNLPDILNNMRQFARAESLDRVNVRTFPNEPSMREGWVHRLVELNRLDEAGQVLDSALARFPRHWGLQWWKLRMLYFRGRLDEFELALDSLSRDPSIEKQRVAMDHRARMANMRGRLLERSRLLAEAQSRASASGGRGGAPSPVDQALDELWVAQMRNQDVAPSIRRLDDLRQASPPRNPQEAFNAASPFASAGRPDIARRYIERFLGWVPDSLQEQWKDSHFIAWAWHFIAVAENRPREAIELRWRADRYKDGFPGPCEICLFRDLGWAYDKLGDADSTILMFEKFVNNPSRFSLEAHPGDVHNYLRRLGELYERKENREKAIDYYSRFVELWKNADPDLQPQVADIRARITRLKG